MSTALCFRGIDAAAVLKNYAAGAYSRIVVSPATHGEQRREHENDASDSTVVRLVEPNGVSHASQRYLYVDTTSTKQVIVTTNHDAFVDPASDKPKVCRYCRRRFTGPHVGIPLRIDSHHSKPANYTIVTEGVFCRFECCYKIIKQNRGSSPSQRRECMMDSESLVLLVFALLYPDRTLVESADFWLREENGGPLTDEEFYSDSHNYVELPSILVRPAKAEYLRHKRTALVSPLSS